MKPSHARKGRPAEDPERARERIAAVIAGPAGLGLKRASGSGLLAALRHGAPVLVQVGAGSDDDDDTQGTDGAGGADRRAAVLTAPDDAETLEGETEDAARWSLVLAGLGRLRATQDGPDDMRGAEAASTSSCRSEWVRPDVSESPRFDGDASAKLSSPDGYDDPISQSLLRALRT